MNKRNQTFREILKNTFLKYSVRPMLVLFLCFVCLFTIVGGITIHYRSTSTHSALSTRFYSTLSAYRELMGELCDISEITTDRLSTTKQDTIKHKLNAIFTSTGVDAELYVLDSERNINYSDQDDLSADIKAAAKSDWPMSELWLSRSTNKRIFLSSPVYSDADTITGYIVIALRDQYFNRMLGEYNLTGIVTDGSDWVFAHTGYQYLDAIGKLASVFRANDSGVNNNGSGFLLCSRGLYYRAYTFDPVGQIYVYTFFDVTDTILAFITCIVTAMLLIFIMSHFFKKHADRMAWEMTSDVVELQKAFEAASAGDMKATADIHSSAEFEAIGQDFHRMLSSLEEHIEQNRELAEAVAMEQVKHLCGQFNTHFLYNTLDNIRFICQVDPELAEQMVLSLSSLLRYSNSSINEQVTIEEDMNYIGKYLNILNVRFMERMSYDVSVDPQIRNCSTIKLLLQPIVENSIKYGFMEDEKLHISIDARRTGDAISFVCSDNGIGIPHDTLSLLQANLDNPENVTKHIGLYNVNRRIKLIYGSQYGITVTSSNGTVVTVHIPYTEE